MKLSTVATILNGALHGVDADLNHISIDSRAIQPDDCFVAIKGELFDGHDFIADVVNKNASAVIVDRPISEKIPHIIVSDTREALKKLARFYRENTAIPVAAITGSCGKTTTRALLENILKQTGHVLASQKSFNNDIGLPLTLLQLNTTHDFIVLEIGANHPGEIATLTAIAKPTVAVITMVSDAHIEYFGSVEAIAREKGAIFSELASDGIAIINTDDVYADLWKKLAGWHRVITFGCTKKADVTASNITLMPDGTTTFTLHLPNKSISIALPLLGEHNIINALAAAAMAVAMQANANDIKIGLETVKSEYGRLVEKKGFLGATIIDDSYNANPESVKAAIKLLTHRTSHSILVLGDMLELGELADQLHREIGEFAKAAQVKKLFCYGKYSVKTVEGFEKGAQHFNDHQTLIDALKKNMTSESIVLVKGSRGMKMEKIVEALLRSHPHSH